MRSCLIILLSLISLTVAADQRVIDEMLKFKANPNEYIFNYTDRPAEVNLNQNNIKTEALKKTYNDETANTIRNNFDKRPDYKITEQELTKSKLLIDNSDNIVHGISNEYVDCTAVKECKTEYGKDINYCTASPAAKTYNCEKARSVDIVIPDKINKIIKVQLKTTAKYGGRYQYNLRTQKLIYNSQTLNFINQDLDINDIACSHYSARIVDLSFMPGTYISEVIKVASLSGDCNNPVIDITIDQGNYHKHKRVGARGVVATIDLSSQSDPIITDNFSSNCPEINRRLASGICVEDKSICVDGKDTRLINGNEVTRDCWRYDTTYKCGSTATASANQCKSYENNNCMQVSSDCIKYIDGICVEQSNGYKCLTNNCSDTANITCGDSTKILCFDGNCVEKAIKEPSDFSDSVTKLSVISEAVKNPPSGFTEDTGFIFPGRAMKCRKSGYGFSDCCKNKGWGQDLELVKCTNEEKELGLNREKQQVIYAGRIKHKDSERRDNVYCVFDSKVAKIIQEQGRRGQLGISFGSGKNPNCTGISPNQLAKIDIDKINLKSAFDEALSHHKNVDGNEATVDLSNKINKYYTDRMVNHG